MEPLNWVRIYFQTNTRSRFLHFFFLKTEIHIWSSLLIIATPALAWVTYVCKFPFVRSSVFSLARVTDKYSSKLLRLQIDHDLNFCYISSTRYVDVEPKGEQESSWPSRCPGWSGFFGLSKWQVRLVLSVCMCWYMICNMGKCLLTLVWTQIFSAFANNVDPVSWEANWSGCTLSLSMWICIKNLDQVIWLAEN